MGICLGLVSVKLDTHHSIYSVADTRPVYLYLNADELPVARAEQHQSRREAGSEMGTGISLGSRDTAPCVGTHTRRLGGRECR